MAPPTYADLGKSSKDLFGKGFHHGFLKLDSTTSSDNFEFKNGLSNNLTNGDLAGSIDLKYTFPTFILTEKWTTDNKLGTVLEMKDQLAKGTKLTFDLSYNPTTAIRSALVKSEWFNDTVKINTDLSVLGGPIFNISGVAFPFTRVESYPVLNNLYVGAQFKFDLASQIIKNHNIAFGQLTRDYAVHSYCNDGREFGGSLYHKVNKNLEMGAQLSWINNNNKGGANNVNYGLVSKYRLNKDTQVQAKIDSKSMMAVSTIHDLGEGLKLTLSSQFQLGKGDSTKFGVGLEFKPECCGGK